METISLSRFARALCVCFLLATGLLIVGCDSGGANSESGGGDGPGDVDVSQVGSKATVEVTSSSSSSSAKAFSKAGGGVVTVTFFYETDQDGSCTKAKSKQIAPTPEGAEKTFSLTPPSCDTGGKTGVSISYVSLGSSSGVTLTVRNNGQEVASSSSSSGDVTIEGGDVPSSESSSDQTYSWTGSWELTSRNGSEPDRTTAFKLTPRGLTLISTGSSDCSGADFDRIVDASNSRITFLEESDGQIEEVTYNVEVSSGTLTITENGGDETTVKAKSISTDPLSFVGCNISDGGDDDNSVGSQLPSASLNLDGSPTVKTGTTVSLNGSFSDPDGDNLTFAWAFDKPDGSSASLNGRESTAPTFTPDMTGSYSVSLSVIEESTGEPTAEIEVARAVTVAVTSSGEGGSVPSSLRGDWKVVEDYDASEDATETPDDEYVSFTEDQITFFEGKCFAAKLPIMNVDGSKVTIGTGSEAATNDFDVSNGTLTLTTVSSSSTDGSAVGDVATAERVSDFEFTGECSLDQ